MLKRLGAFFVRNCKPLWKRALKKAVALGGDQLQGMVQSEVRKNVRKAGDSIEPLIQKWVNWVSSQVQNSWIPDRIEGVIVKISQEAAGKLKERLALALESGSSGAVEPAVDKAFDEFQAYLIREIDAL